MRTAANRISAAKRVHAAQAPAHYDEPGRLTISVIIPTKNRDADLLATIESLLAQTRLPDELIVVDQSARPSFTQPVPIPLRYIHDPSLSGLTAARNAGLELARGDIFLFLDDDVILDACFLEEIARAFQPGIAGVSGIITNYRRPAFLRGLWEAIFVRGPFRDQRQRFYWRANRLRDGKPIRIRQMTGANMGFRAELFQGRKFDTNLTGSCAGEDLEFCASLPRGSTLVLNPRARLEHKRTPVARDSTYWLALQAQVSTYLRERHWKGGLKDSLAFAWLNVGYALAALLSSLRRRSLEPWRRWRAGAAKGFALACPETSGTRGVPPKSKSASAS